MAKRKNTDNSALITGILYILIGILFCVFRGEVLSWMMTAIAVLCIVAGVVNLCKNRITDGVIMAAVGVLVLLGGWLFVDILFLVLGVMLTAKGILDLVRALEVKNNTSAVMAALFSIAVGIMLIISKWALLNWLFIVLGIVLIVDGALIALGKKKS